MHVTFLLGNGFDLNVGLKTSYRNFRDAYLKQRGGDKIAKQCRQIIRRDLQNNEDLWSDMELALGGLSAYFPEEGDPLAKGRRKYCQFLKHIQCSLNAYLLAQVKRIDVTSNQDAICREFEKALACPFEGLKDLQLQQMQDWWKNHTKEAVNYHFLNFNFTPTFEQCRKTFEDRTFRRQGSPFIRRVNRRKVVDTMEVTRHVHGKLNDCIIFGVDHPEQIYNTRLCDDKVHAGIIKPIINCQLKNGQATEAEKLICQSQLIVIFGMSLGQTNLTWWRIIANWLASNEQNRLIAVESGPDYKTEIPDPVFHCKEKVDRVFRDLLTDVAWNRVQNQIFTSINCIIDNGGKHLFNFSVITPKPAKIPIRQRLKVTGKQFADSCAQTNQALKDWLNRSRAAMLDFAHKVGIGDEPSETAEESWQDDEPTPIPESRYQTSSPLSNSPRSNDQSADTTP